MSATSPVPSSSSSSESTAVQSMSIHYLSLRKVTRVCKVGMETNPSLAGLVNKVVNIYNTAHPKQRYERFVVDQAEGDFRVDVYGHRTSFTTKLGSWVQQLGADADLTVQKISYLIFYRREFKKKDIQRREIFALTTGQAHHVVERVADYQFPIRLAKRIGDPKVLETKRRLLSGAVLIYSETFKQASSISSSDAIRGLFTRAKFIFRKDASMFHFDCFRTKEGKLWKQGANLEIGLSSIRFGKKLNPKDFQEVLPHLSLIAHGDPTYPVPAGKKPEKDSEDLDYLEYLQPVDFTTVPMLERQLIKFIHATVVNKKPFPPLDFCHSHRSDYFRGSEYEFQYDNQRLDCTDPFSAAAMVKSLRKLKPLSTCSDLIKFTAELKKVFVSFLSCGAKQKAPFIDFFEGEVRVAATGDTYWRLHKVWFQVRADYLGLVHQEFINSLGRTLIASGEAGALSEKWPSPKEKETTKAAMKKAHKATCKDKSCNHLVKYDVEAEYNANYITKKNFYFGDKICPQKIELFDILYHTDQEIYLYHVKEGFGQNTRDACSQIVNAAKLLHTLKHQASSNILKEFYKEATEYKGDDPRRKAARDKYLALTEKGLINLFAERRQIIFVYAFIDEAKSVRLLSKDRDIKIRVKSTDLETANGRFNSKGQKIFDALVKEGYLMKKGYLTSKFFSTSAAKFSLNGFTVANQLKTLHEHLSSHASQFDSTIAKLEVLRTEREVKNLGFDFRIFQILRTDYPADGPSGRRAPPPKDHADTDELSELDDEPNKPLEIGEGDDFQHGGVTYHIHPTKADGACGLHALLGQFQGGYYIFREGDKDPWLAVRQHYVAQFTAQYGAFSNQISQCLVSLLEDYLGTHPSRYVSMVFDDVRGEIAILRAELVRIKAEEDTAKATQEGLFRDLVHSQDNGIQEHLSQSLDFSLDELQATAALRNAALRERLNPVLRSIEGTPIGMQISSNRQLLNDLDQERKNLYSRFVQKACVIEAYRKACLNRDYFISSEELVGIGSWIFGLRVTVFAHQGADQAAPFLQDGPAGGRSVYIFHKEIHFSRCEVVRRAAPAAAPAPAAAASAAATASGSNEDVSMKDVPAPAGYDSDIDARHGLAPAPAAAANDDNGDVSMRSAAADESNDDTRLGSAPIAVTRAAARASVAVARTRTAPAAAAPMGAASATATASPSEPMDTSD